jgi:hypothetical protein
MLKELLYGVAQKTERTVAAEDSPKILEARNLDGLVERAAIRSADECGTSINLRRNGRVRIEPKLSAGRRAVR